MPGRVQQHSAGGVVVKHEEGPYVLLIKPHNRNRWQLPKGTIDPGEKPETTAVREVREEAGVDASIVGHLGPITFFYQMHGNRFVKTVDFYLMEYKSGSPTNHDDEVDDARWFLIDQAMGTLTFESEQGVVRLALETLQDKSSSVAS